MMTIKYELKKYEAPKPPDPLEGMPSLGRALLIDLERSRARLVGPNDGPELAKAERDFNTQIARWMLSDACFAELMPHPLPSIPEAMQYYNRKTELEKQKVDPGFWQHDDVRNYLDSVGRIKNQNRTSLTRLHELKKMLPEDDFERLAKVSDRIQLFNKWGYREPFEIR